MLAAPSVLELGLRSSDYSYRMGRFCGAILVGSLLGLLGFRLAGRSSLVFNIVLCLVITLNLMGIAFKDYRLSVRRGNDRALAKVEEITKQSRQRHLDELESTGAITMDGASIQDHLNRLEAATSEVKGDEKDLVNATIAASRTLIEPLNDYNAAFATFQNAGGMDPGTMDSKENIAARIKLAAAFASANEGLLKALVASPEQLRSTLESRGHSRDRIDRAVVAYRRESQLELTLKIRETDRELCKTFIGLLELLNEAWGQWQYDADEEQTLFERDEHIDRFNAMQERMLEIVEQQTTLQRQLLQG